ncbi:MAG: hypothetical protein ACRC8C_01710 [Mycoplasmoidaceae bacterium]
MNKKITVDLNSLITATDLVTTYLKLELDVATTLENQKKLVESWKANEQLDEILSRSIIEVLNFTDNDGKTIQGVNVIDSIKFITNTVIPNTGEQIMGPKIKVNLQDGYTSDEIIIQVGNLGFAKA